jgi:hypothetical protein
MTTDAKRVYIYINDEQHLQLKIRLNYHGIGMSEFVRACSQALVDEDKLIIDFLDSYKAKSEKHSKRNSKFEKRDKKLAEQLKTDLNMDDIENIFDIIEEDHPEI